MADMESILRDCPGAGEALLALFAECGELRSFGASVVQAAMNAAMSAMADEACGAAWGERSDARTNSRNGYRGRSLKTTFGDLELEVPKLRRGSFFPDGLLRRFSRVEASLVALVAEMYVSGVSTRSVEALAGELGVSSLSSSEVSRLASCLDAQVEEARTRRLDSQRFCYLWLDATYVRCRHEGRAATRAVVTAIALGADGCKHLVGLDVVDTESHQGWRAFLGGLRARGLEGVVLVISDAHAGLVRAIGEVFQGVPWQRCTVHLQRNVSDAVRRKCNEALVRELVKAAFAQRDPLVARALYDEARAAVRAAGEAAAADLLDSARDDALQYLELPPEHWVRTRTNNVQERANREIKRRCRSVQCFPSEASLMRLVGSVMLEEDDAWQVRRVFSPESVARAWAPREAPAPDAALAREIAEAGRVAREICAQTVDRFAPKG